MKMGTRNVLLLISLINDIIEGPYLETPASLSEGRNGHRKQILLSDVKGVTVTENL